MSTILLVVGYPLAFVAVVAIDAVTGWHLADALGHPRMKDEA